MFCYPGYYRVEYITDKEATFAVHYHYPFLYDDTFVNIVDTSHFRLRITHCL